MRNVRQRQDRHRDFSPFLRRLSFHVGLLARYHRFLRAPHALTLFNNNRYLTRNLALRQIVTLRAIRMNVMMIYRGLLSSARLRFQGFAVQAFPCRRGRILRRICLFSIRFHLHSVREIRHGKLFLNMTSVLPARVFTRSLMKVAYVRCRRVHSIFI